MKLYVAAASAEIERARAFIAGAKERGHEITYDWTEHIRLVSEAYPDTAEADLPDAIRKQALYEDMVGVISADRLILLAPNAATKGAWVELGMALIVRSSAEKCDGDTSSYSIWIAGQNARATIFTATADRYFTDDFAALAALRAA